MRCRVPDVILLGRIAAGIAVEAKLPEVYVADLTQAWFGYFVACQAYAQS